MKSKPVLGPKSFDMAAYFKYAISVEQEIIADIEELSGSEYFSRLKSGTRFSIGALDSGRYSTHFIMYCSVPSAETLCEDDINVISPDSSVH